jgi:hypothetical protein
MDQPPSRAPSVSGVAHRQHDHPLQDLVDTFGLEGAK